MDALLGIDMGTTNIKAIAYTRQGQPLAAGESHPQQPPDGQEQQASQAYGKQAQRKESPAEQQVDRRGQQIVEGWLMELIPQRGNRHVRWKATRLDLLQVLMGIVAWQEDRQPFPLSQAAHVVEVRRLVGGLPRRRENGKGDASEQISQQDDRQPPSSPVLCPPPLQLQR